MRFEVFFEKDSLVLFPEPYGYVQLPGAVASCRSVFAAVVIVKASVRVLCYAEVSLTWIRCASQQIDVGEV